MPGPSTVAARVGAAGGARSRVKVMSEEEDESSHVRAMRAVQRSQSVRMMEAESKDATESAATQLQRFIRVRFLKQGESKYQIRLHCRHLAERLLYEDEIYRGTFRLLNQALILALMLISVSLCATSSVRLGIRTNLRSTFDLDALSMITQRDEFERSLQLISKKAKEYFPLSSRRFDVGERGDMQLIDQFRSFVQPNLLPLVDVTCLSTFSITTWVKLTPEFDEGYVIRKSAKVAGQGSDLACWSLFLHKDRGPELHFGVHDDLSGTHLQVGLKKPHPIASDMYHLVTMTINGTTVDFYENLQHLGTTKITRPMTDCHNGGNGIFVGDKNMHLGNLRTYVRALTPNNIQEIYELGATLESISTGSEPAFVEKSQLDLLRADVTEQAARSASGVEDIKDSAELNSVVQQVQAELRTTQVSYASPAMTSGNIDVESWNVASGTHTTKTDPEISRSYYQLVTGPQRLSATSDTDARYLVNVPTFVGTGATLSWWHRHHDCGGSNCGLYLMHAFDESGIQEHSYCWSIWLETNALWYDNLKGTPKYQYPKFSDEGLQEKYKFRGDKYWRHLSFTWDEVDDTVRFYVDGTLVTQTPWGSAVTGADCNGAGKRVSFGHSHPGYTYGGEVEIYDLRMYIHNLDSPSRPLTSADVLKVATAATPVLDSTYKCKSITEVLDTTWHDDFGNTCDWYMRKRATHPLVCELKAARQNCPIACTAIQECNVVEEVVPMYQVWDRVRRLEPKATNASLCLDSSLSPSAVVQQCKSWKAKGGLSAERTSVVEGWLESMTVGREGRRLNLTDACENVEKAIDEHCGFNMSAVRQFTRESRKNNGDMTLTFWVKPLGNASLVKSRFFPQVSLFSSLYPPQQPLTQGIWFNPNGEFRVSSSCRPLTSRWPFENVEQQRASESEWTFFAISIRNLTSTQFIQNLTSAQKTKITVFTNLGRNSELSDFPICFYNQDALFQAIEYNYAMLMSPLVMIPKALPDAKIQSLFYKSFYDMPTRIGPRIQQRERVKEVVIREKLDYAPKSALVATPVIFQERKKAAESCDVVYSSKWSKEQQRKATREVCSSPYFCPEISVNLNNSGHSEGVVSCPSKQLWTNTFFGVKSAELLEKQGFADFLFSITDNGFVYRSDNVSANNASSASILRTKDFIDSLTDTVRIILVFYTPQYGITSNVLITAKFHGSQGARVDYELLHYEIIEGTKLGLYIFVQSLVIFNLAAMLVEVINNLRTLYVEAKLGISISKAKLVTPVLDLLAFLLILVYVCLRIVDKAGAASTAEAILSDLDGIEWSSPQITLAFKKDRFLHGVKQLYSMCIKEARIDILCNVILLVNLFRVIQCTSMHPRLNLLLGTLKHAMNDLFHALILIGLLMAFFAGIGNWRFGSRRSDFATFTDAMGTEFQMMFGEFPDNWNDSAELQMFIILYFIVIFVFVLNFLLAIVVEAYMELREEIKGRFTSKDFVSDLVLVAHASRMGYRHSWPDPEGLGSLLSTWKARISIGYQDLLRTGLFGGRGRNFIANKLLRHVCFPCSSNPCNENESVLMFLNYYSAFDFLIPPEVGKYGFKNDSLTKAVSSPSKSLSYDLSSPHAGNQLRSPLKEQLDTAMQIVANRRNGTQVQRSLANASSSVYNPHAAQHVAGHYHVGATGRHSVVVPGVVPYTDDKNTDLEELDGLIQELHNEENGAMINGSSFGSSTVLARAELMEEQSCSQAESGDELYHSAPLAALSQNDAPGLRHHQQLTSCDYGNNRQLTRGQPERDIMILQLKIELARAEAERNRWQFMNRTGAVN